jgi:cation diffusion facilitator CzcD-associated flavoprotein CzcO
MSLNADAPRHVFVLVVGSGFAGLGLAIKLTQSGRRDYLVIERGSEVGGTWRDNTYPGAACDVPSQLYSYSFAPNPNWTRSFSPQPEIQAYIRGVAEKSGVLKNHLFQLGGRPLGRRDVPRPVHRDDPGHRVRRAV